MLIVNASKPLFFSVEIEFNGTGRAISVFFNKDIRNIFSICLGIIVFLAVDKCYNIGVLLDRT